MTLPLHARRELGSALAAAFLNGVWTERAMANRAARSLGERPKWLLPLVREVRRAYVHPPHDRPRELAAFVAEQLDRLREARRARRAPRVVVRAAPSTRMAGRVRWPVRRLDTPGDLAEWLELDAGQLAWLADVRSLERTAHAEQLRNYRYAWRPRGSGVPRVIEAPKGRLREIQRALLADALRPVPAHDAAHGFVRGRSAVTHARVHTGARVVVRFDLEDFFAAVTARRIFGVFRTAGYAEPVAHLLTGLTTNAVPAAEWARVPVPPVSSLAGPAPVHAHARLGRRLAAPHLPQGAPTSPALANLVAHALDRRLTGLAARFGARYSRYADDLAFSGDALLVEAAPTLRAAVRGIVRAEGFTLHPDKTSLVTRAGRQRVCGVVVNAHPNVARAEYDRLKAILHDAATNGPAHANRAGHDDLAAHLLGRISWVGALNPARGAKLRERFDAIDWAAG